MTHSFKGLILASLVGSLAVTLGCSATERVDPADTVSADEQRAMTPDEALAQLKAGNERYTSGESTRFEWLAQARQTADGQYPHSIVLSCLDSRVPVEAIFDQGIGDIFVGRVAGNFENTDMLGSMEFGTKLAGSKLIVVLGHTSCGAVKGTIAGAEMGNLTETLENIEPAVERTRVGSMGRTTEDPDYVARVVEENVRITVRDIRERSEIIQDLVRSGDLKVVGAVYDLRSGEVAWLD